MEDLYVQAERLGHTVLWYPFCGTACMAIVDEEGCVIGIDPRQLRSRADERVKLAHELGHCETGAFYSRTARDRARQEERANRWAIVRLLPLKSLRQALQEGDRTVSELAERFSVTEDFVQEAVAYYRDAQGLRLEACHSETRTF